jgi:choline dehydrogenase-like flavoprotein
MPLAQTAATAVTQFDYDWLIVGSGFGGSVSALRLSEKGYRVGVLECGRRYADHEYASTTWDLRRFLWAPAFGLRGILRLTPFKDIFIASGSAVGGGSAVYANTLYRANDDSLHELRCEYNTVQEHHAYVLHEVWLAQYNWCFEHNS